MKNKKGVLLVSIILVFSIVTTGCMKSVSNKIGTKIGEKVLEKALGEDVKIDAKDGISISTEGGSMQAGEDLKWPSDSMQTLPKPNGKIVSIFESTDDDTTTVMFETKENEGKSYYEQLRNLGYIETMQSKAEDMSMYTLVKDDSTLVMFYDYTSSNSAMIIFERNSNMARQYFEEQQESDSASEEPLEVDMSDSMEWPKDSMKNVPELKGKIKGVATSNEYVFVEFEAVSKEDIFQYMEKLKSVGFTESMSEYTTQDNVNFSATNSDKSMISLNWEKTYGYINYMKATE